MFPINSLIALKIMFIRVLFLVFIKNKDEGSPVWFNFEGEMVENNHPDLFADLV